MKKILILLIVMFMVSVCGADTVRIWWGGPDSRVGYQIDSGWVLHHYGNNIDTLFDTIYIDATNIDTFVVITGTGEHKVAIEGYYDGYPEWYEIKDWPVTLSTSASEYGSGIYECTLWTIDSSVTNDSVRSGVEIQISDASGSPVVNPITGTGGSIVVNLNAGSYTTKATSQRQIWGDGAFTISDNDSIAILGYSTYTLYVVSAPADTNLCIVYGTVRYHDQTLVKSAKVTITPPDGYQNICDSTFSVMQKKYITQTGPWNGYSDGYFADTLLKSSCMHDTTLVYKIEIKKGNYIIDEIEINIPRDSGSYLVTGFSE